MGWPLAFREKLAAGVLSPIFVLQSEESLDLFASAPITAGSLQTVYPWLAIDGLTFGQYGVQPIEWIPESGAWRFAIIAGAPDEGRRLTVLRALGRGCVVRLRVGFPGDSWPDYQICAQGRIAKLEIGADGLMTFGYEQDAEQAFEAVLKHRNEGAGWAAGMKKDMVHALHIPNGVLMELRGIGVDVYTMPLADVVRGLKKLGRYQACDMTGKTIA